jgi:transposase, IS5 family
LLDRRSFLQFLGLTDSSTIFDAKTIWLFRDRLVQGYRARCGQIIDASLVQALMQRIKCYKVIPKVIVMDAAVAATIIKF